MAEQGSVGQLPPPDSAPPLPHPSPETNEHIERLLDEALAATFPASDPVSTLDV